MTPAEAWAIVAAIRSPEGYSGPAWSLVDALIALGEVRGVALADPNDSREETLRAWWAEMFPRQAWIADALDRTNFLMHEHERLSATRAVDALVVLREAEPVLADMIAGRGIGGPPSWAIVIQDIIRRARALLATGPDSR